MTTLPARPLLRIGRSGTFDLDFLDGGPAQRHLLAVHLPLALFDFPSNLVPFGLSGVNIRFDPVHDVPEELAQAARNGFAVFRHNPSEKHTTHPEHAVSVRTVPIDPSIEIAPPPLDDKGQMRWIVPLDRSFLMILYALELSSIVILAAVFIATGQDLWLMLAILVFLLIMPLVMYRSCRLTLTLADDHLRWVFFPFWAGRIPYEAIESVEVCTYSALGDFGGWGPKMNFKQFGLISGGNRGVLIKRLDGKRDVVASCPEPESLALELLRRVTGDRQAPHMAAEATQ